ncbi:MAG: hypothetical protein K2X99_01790 [Gemmatimonadaceae bacterium]|nr:hypothetical protein [Gemmatimonadaceae bacterium]
MPLLLPLTLALQVTADVRTTRPRTDSTKRQTSITVGVSLGAGNLEDRKPPRRVPVTDELRRTAFKDESARTLLLRARVARMQQDSALLAYDAMAYQRINVGMGLRAIGRDRVLFRHEDASRVRWQRGRGVWAEMKGARSYLPGDSKSDDPSNDLDGDIPIPYYPGREQLWVGSGLAKAEVDERELVHPIAEGSEAYYRYATGDSVIITLPDGKKLTLRELRCEPRAPRWNLAVGSFWFDEQSAQLVRAVYRLAIPIDIWNVAQAEDSTSMDDVPMFVKPLISPMRANISAISLEFGLYNQRFWLPRLQELEAEAVVSFMRIPVTFEQRFKYAAVNGTDSLPTIVAVKTRRELRDSLKTAGVTDSLVRDSLVRDIRRSRTSAAQERKKAQCAATGTYTTQQSRQDGALQQVLEVPCDAKKLENSAELPGSLFGSDESVFQESDIEELKKSLDFGLQAAWGPRPPTVEWGLAHTRYNRVEGFGSGVLVKSELGKGYALGVGARASWADRQLNGDVTLTRTNGRETVGVTAYRRLAVASDWGSPLSFGTSVATLLNARDEGFYYRAAGLELTQLRRGGKTRSRLFVEQQFNAPVASRWSLTRGANDSRFLTNVAANKGVWYGAATEMRGGLGLDPRGLRLSTLTKLEGAAGESGYLRGVFEATLSRELLGSAIALTAAAGTTEGTVPAQREFFLGGLWSVRGQAAGTMRGNAFWMGRAEIALSNGVFRPLVFGDVGWAGDRNAFDRPGRPMSGVGVGGSLLDGMIRMDVARGLYPVKQWRTDLYLEARF